MILTSLIGSEVQEEKWEGVAFAAVCVCVCVCVCVSVCKECDVYTGKLNFFYVKGGSDLDLINWIRSAGREVGGSGLCCRVCVCVCVCVA